jgi:peptidoglycan/xylan/chitin deacetylase (PgdA/CDA1 family)
MVSTWEDVRTGFLGRASRLLVRKRILTSTELPVVSFTFDDFPSSSCTNGSRILDDFGVAGTFYAAGSLCARTVDQIRYFNLDDLRHLAIRGHEIGCHTFSHRRVSFLLNNQIQDEIRRNAEFLAANGAVFIKSFAYPFGDISPRSKQVLSAYFASCRSIQSGLNAGNIDLGQLRAVALYDRVIDPGRLSAIIEGAIRIKAWLIFYTHDVQENPSPYGCSPKLLREAVAYAFKAGARILTVGKAVTIATAGYNDLTTG